MVCKKGISSINSLELVKKEKKGVLDYIDSLPFRIAEDKTDLG